MKNQAKWFIALPYSLALRLTILSAARKLTKLPAAFSYAQGAEDLIIEYIARYHFSMTKPGKYVDVGCNAPMQFSNTFDLYLKGWRGLNIDANSKLIDECRRVRKEDVCICAAVSDTEREVTFHKGKDDAVSTIDGERLVEWKKYFEFSEDDQESLITRTLTSILDDSWKKGDDIDLLSIDVEGHDFQVLKSLDFAKYRPKIIVIEMHDFSAVEGSDINQYLVANGYALKYFAFLNAYFTDSTTR